MCPEGQNHPPAVNHCLRESEMLPSCPWRHPWGLHFPRSINPPSACLVSYTPKIHPESTYFPLSPPIPSPHHLLPWLYNPLPALASTLVPVPSLPSSQTKVLKRQIVPLPWAKSQAPRHSYQALCDPAQIHFSTFSPTTLPATVLWPHWPF